VPPAGRTPGGYRLYDATSVARLELVHTLRELGVGLEDIRRMLAKETTVAQVAATGCAHCQGENLRQDTTIPRVPVAAPSFSHWPTRS
jgi:DNA-binding transcriptional MerR regulator